MEKVKVTQEQAKAIENYKELINGVYDFVHDLGISHLTRFAESGEEEQKEMKKLMYAFVTGNYEVEPEFLDDLTTKIKRWAVDRNLHTAIPDKQMLKLFEELGELAEGMAKDMPAQVTDSIGDIYVVLTILTLQLGINIEDCIAEAYDEIKDRKGRLIDGVFVKEEDLSGTDKDNDFLEKYQDYQGDWEDD